MIAICFLPEGNELQQAYYGVLIGNYASFSLLTWLEVIRGGLQADSKKVNRKPAISNGIKTTGSP